MEFNVELDVREDGTVCRPDGRPYPISKDKYGYWRLSTYNPDTKKRKSYLVHRLVAMVHLPRPEGTNVVDHKDGNKDNNHKDNLEWVTLSENTKRAYDKGLSHFKPRNVSHAIRDWKGRFS